MNIVNDILVNNLFPDTDFIQTLDMNSVVPKYVENQEKGNPSVCKNCAEAPFKDLHIYGRSEQMTTTGAQLFDAASIKKNDKIQVEISDNSYTIQMTTTINESGSPSNRVYIAINHVIEGDFSGKTVTLSYDGVNSDVPNERYVIGLMYNTDDGRTHYLSLQKDMPKSISVTLPENTTNLTLRLFITEFTSPTVPAGTYRVTIRGAMLTEGSEKKDWEPYTGGKPSPSPDYPQEIVSAGDGGSVAVKVTGKNLLDFLHAEITKAGWLGKFTRDEEILTISAVNGWNAYWFVSPVRGKQISVSFTYRQIDDKTFDDGQSLVVGTSAKPSYIETGVYSIKSPKKSWTKITCTMISETYVGVMLRVKNEGVNEERTIEIKDFQLELGSTATAYSPYREQLLTLPTPNGLPGVPVTSGGNYTDPQGQQWICDEVDFGRGVYVKKTKEFRFASSAFRWNDNQIANFNIFYFDSELNNIIDGKMGAASSCYFRWNNNFETDNTFRIVSGGLRIRMDSATSLDDFKAKFPDGIDVLCILSLPIETPLTAAEIAAYKSLRSYRGTTIVEAEDKAGISVKYNMPMPKLSKNGALRRWFKRHPII
jgi:hypothetical protein